jgi:hypothetical protein
MDFARGIAGSHCFCRLETFGFILGTRTEKLNALALVVPVKGCGRSRKGEGRFSSISKVGFWASHFRRKSLMEAEVGIGQFTPLLRPQYTRIHWLLNLNRHNPVIPFLTPLVSVLVSVMSKLNALLAVMARAPPLLERVVGSLSA